MQAYLRGEPTHAMGIGLKAKRASPAAAPVALPVASAADLEAALQLVLGQPGLALPGPRGAELPASAAAPALSGTRCDMPEAHARSPQHA